VQIINRPSLLAAGVFLIARIFDAALTLSGEHAVCRQQSGDSANKTPLGEQHAGVPYPVSNQAPPPGTKQRI
jgi:hypothetical protein